jgi:pimeloyl-ACP methyl ester carboxylesterase
VEPARRVGQSGLTEEATMPDVTFTLPGAVTAYRWDPVGEPAAVLQLTHGMGEHVLRYERVARAFTERGFAVYGQDHRGHGASIRDVPGDLGPDGWAALVADIGVLTSRIREERPACRWCCSRTAWARSRRSSTCSTTPRTWTRWS